MNKTEFVDHISQEHSVTKTEADRILNIITASITSALAKRSEIALIGFGKFHTSKVAARQGRNPKTGAPLSIEAYTQVKFSAGQSLKNSCNGKGIATGASAITKATKAKDSKDDKSTGSNKTSKNNKSVAAKNASSAKK